MWKIAERLLGSLLNARYAKNHSQADPHFHRVPLGTDTVVFVHGLHGHILECWAKFPELVADDPALPSVDILMWGYRATILPGASLLGNVAEMLMAFVRAQIRPYSSLFFVGHSLGGLVILRGLCDEAAGGRAREHPAAQTRRVQLFASPVNGSEVASVISLCVGIIPKLRYFISGHLKELKRGSFSDTLVSDLRERIYWPRIRLGDENYKIGISIQACVAEHDIAVKGTSARSIFSDPPPLPIAGQSHSSIKEPEHRRDTRYLALQVPLAEHFRIWFYEISRSAMGGDVIAREDVLERAYAAATARLLQCSSPNGPRVSDARIEELLAIAMQFSMAASKLTFGEALDRALAKMKRLGR